MHNFFSIFKLEVDKLPGSIMILDKIGLSFELIKALKTY